MSFLQQRFGRLAAECLRINEASRDSVLLLHGLGFNKEMFRPTMAKLAESDRLRDVLAFDMPCHGDSESVPLRTDNGEAFVDWRDLTEALREAVGAWRQQNPPGCKLHCLAHSMSGAVSVQACITQQEPLFASLVLVEPIILPPPYTRRFSQMPASNPALSASKRRDNFASVADAIEYYSTREAYLKWNPESLRLHVEHSFRANSEGGITMKMPRDVQAAIYCGGQGTRLLETLQNGSFALPPTLLCSAALSWFNAGADGDTLTSTLCKVLRRHAPVFDSRILGDGLTHALPFEGDGSVLSTLLLQNIAKAATPSQSTPTPKL
jgi:pimeloyl-ACP methyl ester carboxylesterase